MSFKVAVVGATGNVGREMLDVLAERGFPVREVVALASSRSNGVDVSFGDKTLKCKSLETYDFSDTGYVASAPALPGCVSQGDTRVEALTNIRDAITVYLEDCREAGDPVPTGLAR